MKPILLFMAAIPFISCSQPSANVQPNSSIDTIKKIFHTVNDIPLPGGFERIKAESNSFTGYLRNLKLKKDNTVYLYNGSPKRNQSAQYAVLDIPVPKVDLQQCADAVMRIRAEYLFGQKRFSEITFTDNAHGAYSFSPPYTKEHFDKYLLLVFANCGTASLSKQLNEVKGYDNIEPGDVLIKGGSPGHAVIVMDAAINKEGKKAYMLAQSYMPAQDIHILKNPKHPNSPWYFAENDNTIYTPEWVFYKDQLKRW
ncbi:MAG: hypothetical protein HYR66_00090 [Sphingobacteriales bacterium]|nr:hypothetical protein [Sphingobacteriales bacterium]MBI3719550.1 hypothetical protein [Sphingobacteriales bacterium]